MAYESQDQSELLSGKPVKAEIAIRTANNTDDLNTRTNALEGGAGKVIVLNATCRNAAQWASGSTFTGLHYFKAPSGFSIVSAVVTQFTAGDTGSIEIDILKAATVDDTFVSLMNVKPSVFANGSDIEVVDYSALSGETLTVTINGVANVLTEGSEWTAATSNDVTADSLRTAIDALTGVTAENPPAAIIDVQANNTYQVTFASSDAVNLTVGQTSIAGNNTKSSNADFSTTAITQGEYIRVDISAFQQVQKNFHIEITGEIS